MRQKTKEEIVLSINRKINIYLKNIIDFISKKFNNKENDLFSSLENKYNNNSYYFYKNIKKFYNNNINLYFYRPDVVIDEKNEELFPKLDIYKLNSKVENLSIEEKIDIIENKVKIHYINSNNCIYFSFLGDNDNQIFSIAIWLLSPKEIRIGFFIDKKALSTNENISNLKEEFKTILGILDSNIYSNIKYSEKDRENNILIEKIINFDSSWTNFEYSKYLLHLISLLMVLSIVKVLELKED